MGLHSTRGTHQKWACTLVEARTKDGPRVLDAKCLSLGDPQLGMLAPKGLSVMDACKGQFS